MRSVILGDMRGWYHIAEVDMMVEMQRTRHGRKYFCCVQIFVSRIRFVGVAQWGWRTRIGPCLLIDLVGKHSIYC